MRAKCVFVNVRRAPWGLSAPIKTVQNQARCHIELKKGGSLWPRSEEEGCVQQNVHFYSEQGS